LYEQVYGIAVIHHETPALHNGRKYKQKRNYSSCKDLYIEVSNNC